MAQNSRDLDRLDSDTSSEGTASIARPDSEGWEDAEPDEEVVQVKDFFSDKTFPDATSMIKYCAAEHGFDFLKVVQDFGLDFFGSIKLVNYIRSEAQSGNKTPDISSVSVFEDDRYMQPAIEDDALLFSLDDVLAGQVANETATQDMPIGTTRDKSAELEQELEHLRAQFSEYRLAVEKTLDERWTDSSNDAKTGGAEPVKDENHQDPGYFDSYSYNDIHQIMLQDAVRTDAYRDFIYGNKHLFAGKTVLDVGCGTGILSMFCAKAGAARVIAVDNSNIIDKARINVAVNGFTDRITLVRGKIEEVELPVPKVDIIVSEWMGYTLLYEAMLDSVLYARDKYLKPDGLLVPSHCTLHLAPLADPDHVADNVTFWKDVYGFDMTAMMEKIYEDVLVRYPKKEVIVGRTEREMPFKVLDLHTVTTAELDFKSTFSARLCEDIDTLDGFCVWFDTIFMTSRQDAIPEAMLQGNKPKNTGGSGPVFFTTGPFGPATHWQCGVVMIDRSEEKTGVPLKDGQVIEGSIQFRKNKDAKRDLNITMTWDAKDTEEKSKQLWFMR